MWNQLQDPTPHLLPSMTIFFWSSSQPSFFNESFINFWSHTFLSMTCCFQCSSRHLIQTGVSGPKRISLYFVIVSLMACSRSSFVFIQFWRGIFNIFASSNRDVLLFIIGFVTSRQVTKIFCLLFTPQKIHHHHHCSTCYIAGFLHRCIYTLQYIPEDDHFYLGCRQNRSLTLLLYYNTCHRTYLSFIGPVVSFSNSCNSTSFQIFLYWGTHSFASETLNDIV